MNKRLAWIGGAVALGGIGAFAAVYLFFFTPDSPPPQRLDSSPAAAGAPSPETVVVEGMWRVVAGSEAGYRVREKLASLPASSDAVGKTSGVTGSMNLTRAGDGYSASDINVEVDLTGLVSDKARRDRAIRTRGLETSRFPQATFKSTAPVAVSQEAGSGETVKFTVEGDVTVHGVTKRVSIPLDARYSNNQIEVVGSLTFPMEDFNIDPPNVANVVTVEPRATMEFKLLLQR